LGGTYADDKIDVHHKILTIQSSGQQGAPVFAHTSPDVPTSNHIFDLLESQVTMSDITFQNLQSTAIQCRGGALMSLTLNRVQFSDSVLSSAFGLRSKILFGAAVTGSCNLAVSDSVFRNISVVADGRDTARSAFGGAVAILPNCTAGNISISFDNCIFDRSYYYLSPPRSRACSK
jgi:hypothetical protein